ncbi:MAG TPA: ATP-dependent helicase HrpB [Nitrospirota bacterium]|nr:ATP-dependent helicase HrpB [Nitrospirota bacterium]
MNSYPIDSILPRLKETVQHNTSVVLHAPPGAGKTTRVPLALIDLIPPASGRIVMLEPRRIAAVSAARWMAKSLNEQAGETIGYAIRFDRSVSTKTRIEVVTEGILTRRIQSDPSLEGVAMIIFDEFHERSIHADLALALCLDIRKGLRQDLKILVMSATMDCGPIASLLGNALIITSSGKAFPVEERYLEDSTGPLPVRIFGAVKTALKETNGDILVFLPGSGEIRACLKELQEALNMNEDRISLHALYGDLPFEEQERAIMPSKDKRKIVLATNIAETSLTIEGVHVVIDTGLTRMLRYDASTGMNRLVTVSVSRASAEQRKGRAGRLGPGVCYRLYSKHDLHSMLPFTKPEILVSDLSPLALDLAVWGVKDPHTLSWLDIPPAPAWDSALRLLRNLGALDPSGSVTSIGRAMARLPLHPRLSRLMMRAEQLGCVRLGADLAAILTERDVFRNKGADVIISKPDVSERVDILHKWRRQKESGESTDPPADVSALRAVERTSKELMRLLPETTGRSAKDSGDHDVIARILLSAYPDSICKRREEGGGRFVHVQGRGVRLSLGSHLGSSSYIIAVHADAGEKTEGFVHMAAPVTVELIRGECPNLIETNRRVEWDGKEGRIVAAVEERLGALLLSTRRLTPTDEEAASILCEVMRTNPGILTFSREARQFQGRLGLIRRTFPEETWPDLSDEQLLFKPEKWLLPWLGSIRSAQGLRGLDILPALRATLSWEQQRLLDERAPVLIIVPSGHGVSLDYTSGDLPILAVKLQEMFGLADTPLIAAGRVKILLHLLSPACRPVQITQDLKGFWSNGYPQVKKDLKGRYPKHPWPEDPWNAAPTRRTKPRGP